jgi:hypothetical protein
MSPISTESGTITLALNDEERSLLLGFLEQGLRDKRVEEHRTDALDFKDYVRRQEDILEGLITKLRRA